jgi:hypothetical protein
MSNYSMQQLEKIICACKSLKMSSLLRSIVILFIFILLVFSPNFSRPPAIVYGQSESTCTDSDGGLNYSVAGNVSGVGANGWPYVKNDVCDSTTQLREFYCNGTTPWPKFYSCDSCVDGACVTGTCTDSDGDGYFDEGGGCGPDDCDDTNANVHPGATEVCDNGIDDDCDGAIDALDTDCATGPVCIDSDGGLNYEVAGTVTGIGANGYPFSKSDVCDSTTQLREFYCNGTTPWPKFYACPAGCADGACNPETCIDDDGDGYCVPDDCDDTNANVHPGATEVCDNGIDDDCDGLVDEGCTLPPGEYTDCTNSQIGTILYTHPTNGISTGPILVEVNNWPGFNWPGMVGAQIKTDADIYFPQLPNWLRSLNESNISRLELKVNNWAVDYECIGYGSILGSGGSDPADYDSLKYYTNEARRIASEHGKCLVLAYDPGHLEKVTADKYGSVDPVKLQDLVSYMASRSDVWVIKIAEQIQKLYGPDDQFRVVIEEWANKVKKGNPNAEIWIQMAMQEFGQSEPSAETVLAYREKIVDLVDGVSPMVIYSGESQLQTAVNELENTFWYACMQQAPPPSGR